MLFHIIWNDLDICERTFLFICSMIPEMCGYLKKRIFLANMEL